MTDLDLADAVYGNTSFRIDTEPEPDLDEPQTEEAHPITIVLDTLVKTSDSYLKSKKKPQPNRDAYTNLARPNLDEAFKQLIPVESDAELNPYILLLMGLGGMALVYAPLIIDIVDKKLNEEKPKKRQLPQPPAPAPQPTPEPDPEPQTFKPISIPDEDEQPATINRYLTADIAGKWQDRISQFEE